MNIKDVKLPKTIGKFNILEEDDLNKANGIIDNAFHVTVNYYGEFKVFMLQCNVPFMKSEIDEFVNKYIGSGYEYWDMITLPDEDDVFDSSYIEDHMSFN